MSESTQDSSGIGELTVQKEEAMPTTWDPTREKDWEALGVMTHDDTVRKA
jgi:hypothetical protein